MKQILVNKIGISENCDIFNKYQDFHSGIDLAISMGGDGTFIKTVSYIRDSGVPIMGINTGRLGFLANISKEQIHNTMNQVRDKKNELYNHLKKNLEGVAKEHKLVSKLKEKSNTHTNTFK